MIQLFDIKKNNKKLKLQDNELLNKYAEMSKKNNEEILKKYEKKEKIKNILEFKKNNSIFEM